jgi:tryptophan-rich sensory protein
LFTSTDTAWYQTLAKPSFQPPGWLFGPVWTLLYTLMGIALFRVFERRDHPAARTALGLFVVQLALNGIWSPVFFGAQAIGWALGIIAVMLVFILLTTWRFWSIDRVAGGLFLPYVAWVSFATVLNGSIVSLNGAS